MPSIQAKMISGLFKLIGVNKMLDNQDILTEYDTSSVRYGICAGSGADDLLYG